MGTNRLSMTANCHSSHKPLPQAPHGRRCELTDLVPPPVHRNAHDVGFRKDPVDPPIRTNSSTKLGRPMAFASIEMNSFKHGNGRHRL
jgi:hypothetical protein